MSIRHFSRYCAILTFPDAAHRSPERPGNLPRAIQQLLLKPSVHALCSGTHPWWARSLRTRGGAAATRASGSQTTAEGGQSSVMRNRAMGLTLTGGRGLLTVPRALPLTHFLAPRQVSRAGGTASSASLARRKAPV